MIIGKLIMERRLNLTLTCNDKPKDAMRFG